MYVVAYHPLIMFGMCEIVIPHIDNRIFICEHATHTQRVVEGPSPLTLAKALKNEQELQGMREVRVYLKTHFLPCNIYIYVCVLLMYVWVWVCVAPMDAKHHLCCRGPYFYH